MADKTGISWTDHTWNPWIGCTKVSDGCKNCYMFTDQRRFGQNPEVVRRTSQATWRKPIAWNAECKSARVFTCSWSDWFHPDADAWRAEAWSVIRKTPFLNYQILTKRPERIADCLPADWGNGYQNVWLGVTIENNKHVDRFEYLRAIPSKIRFVSYEPALGPLDALNLSQVDWMIYGGESGPGWRPDDKQWSVEMRERCQALGIPFFHKQLAGPRPGMGIEVDGMIAQEFPQVA